jgi:aryl sulfotransferase
VTPKFERGSEDVHAFYKRWFETDGAPYWSFWENIRSWWEVRELPNVMLIHFNDMKRDLPGSIRRIAAFLDIAVDETVFPKIVEHCGFDYMKAHAETVAPLGGVLWEGGAQTFVNKGTNGRWQGILTAAEVAAYQAKAMAELGADCARWLAMGEAR